MSQRVWMKWMAAAMLVVLSAGSAHATEGVVVGDAYVNSAHATTNYGGLSNLYVNSNGTALIQLDLSSLPTGTTASQIGIATLKLYVNRINTSGVVNIQPVTGAWSESSVTYATMPSLGATVASFTPAMAGQYVVIDITSLVQGWVTTPSSNHGLALTTSAGDVVFDSKENDETSHAAHLDITVVSQGPTGAQGPAGATGATGAAGAAGATGAQGPTGATGAQGPAGANGLVNFRDIYSGSTSYAVGDSVSYNGGSGPYSSYVAIQANTGQAPTNLSNNTYWDLMAQAGDTGATGAAGSTGPQGPAGPQGPTGAAGATGAQGPAGSTGAQGPAGAQGATGATGPAGATGAAGANGLVNFRGIYSGSTSYAVGDAVSYNGGSGPYSSYVAIQANTGQAPAYLSNNTYWDLMAQAGVDGSPGATGPAGATGATGATGPQGPAGTVSANSFEWNALFSNGNYSGTALYFSLQAASSNNGANSIGFSNSNESIAPLACTVSQLSVSALVSTASSGSPDNATFTLYKNGLATSMACTLTIGVSNGNKGGCTTTSNTFTVVPGDSLSIKLSETNFAPVYVYDSHLACM